MNKYQITVTEEQLKILISAVDVLSRIQCGSVSDFVQNLPLKRRVSSHEIIEEISQILDGNMVGEINGWSSTLGIFGEETPNSAKIAWDMYQVFRYAYSWNRAIEEGITDRIGNRKWPKMMEVYYDDVMAASSGPLANIEIIKE